MPTEFRPDHEKCPICGAEVTRDSVDIGVGVQFSPAWCDNCGWHQPGPDFGFKEQEEPEVTNES